MEMQDRTITLGNVLNRTDETVEVSLTPADMTQKGDFWCSDPRLTQICELDKDNSFRVIKKDIYTHKELHSITLDGGNVALLKPGVNLILKAPRL